MDAEEIVKLTFNCQGRRRKVGIHLECVCVSHAMTPVNVDTAQLIWLYTMQWQLWLHTML